MTQGYFQPKLAAKERRTGWPANGDTPWYPVEEVLKPAVETSEQTKARIKAKLLYRWGEHPAVKAVLKVQELRKKVFELTEELLMSVLTRLDRCLPLGSDDGAPSGQ